MKKEISQDNKDFYKLGYSNGVNCLERQLVQLKETNRNLWDMLTNLDKDEPLIGVLMSYKDTETVIRDLRKGVINYPLAAKLVCKRKKAKKKDNQAL